MAGRASPAAGAEDPRAIPLYQPQATDPAAERGGSAGSFASPEKKLLEPFSSGSCRPAGTDSRRAAAEEVLLGADAAPAGGEAPPPLLLFPLPRVLREPEPPPPSYCSPYRVSYGSLNPPLLRLQAGGSRAGLRWHAR